MKRGFRSLPARITAALLTAGLIVSSSNFEYVRLDLFGNASISTVEAEDKIVKLKDENLLKAMEVIVNYSKKNGSDIEALKGKDLASAEFQDYQKQITEDDANSYSGFVDLSGCTINDLSGMNVFYSITGIDLTGYSGTSIPANAFENCKALTTVTISGKVTKIDASAFQNCNSLRTLEVKGDSKNKEGALNLTNIKNIGDSAFNAAKKFEEVVFNPSATDLKLGSNAFSQCTSLIEVNVPTKDLGNLGQGVFSDCTSLVKATLNDELTGIPNLFFQGANLSAMDQFPSKLEKIGVDAFARSYLLTPDLSKCTKLTLIDQGAFQAITYTYNEATDNELRLPESLVDDGIKRIAFFNSSNLQTINIPDGITVIAESTFEGCKLLKNIKTTPNSKLEKIEEWAFRRCDSLNNTDFLKNLSHLTEIGDYAFSECYSLAVEFKIRPQTMIPEEEKENLKDFVDGLLTGFKLTYDYNEEYNEYSFLTERSVESFYEAMLELVLPIEYTYSNSVYADGYGVYRTATGLENVSLPESLTTLGEYAFANNYALKSISMGNNIKVLPKYVFALRADTAHESSTAADMCKLNYADLNLSLENLSYCSEMKEVTLSDKLTDIEEGAFKYNTNLTTVTYNGASKKENTLVLPSTLKNIGDNAFSDCARWSSENTYEELPYVAYGLGNVDLNNLTLDSLGIGVFENDFMLDTAILPTSLQVIPEKLFFGCGKRVDNRNEDNEVTVDTVEFFGLSSVTFPTDVTEISNSAFQDCKNLVYKGEKYKDNVDGDVIELYQLPNTLEIIGDNAFNGCQKLGKVALNVNLKTIGEYAFKDCALLLTDDRENPYFEDGYGLTNISFVPAKQLENIGNEAFSQSAIITADMSYNTKLETIPYGLFSNCYSLVSSELPSSVTKVEENVYSKNIRIRTVQLPAIATVASNIFSDIPAGYFDYYVQVTLATRNNDRKVVVPIGQSITLNFIKSSSDAHNDYSYVQRADGEVLKEEEAFVDCSADKGDVTLYGKRMTPDNSTLSITNFMRFDVKNGNDIVVVPKALSGDYDLTVSDILAEKLTISGAGTGASIEQTENGKVLTISADKITGNDATNTLEVSASVEPSTITKAPIWGADSNDVISVDPIDADNEDTVIAVNSGSVSKANIHVKGIGTTTLWVADSENKEVVDQVTVKVVYPVTGIDYSVASLDMASGNIELEAGKTDIISVSPKYQDDALEADDSAKAEIYFESDQPAVVDVDPVTGKLTAGNEEGSAVITIKDKTGNTLNSIYVQVVQEGALMPQVVKITPDNISVYKNEDSEKITAKVYPEAAEQNVEWYLNDGGENWVVLTKNADGSVTVTGKELGQADLYAKSTVNDNVSAYIPIRVTVPAAEFRFQASKMQVAVNETQYIQTNTTESDDFSVYYEPQDASDDTVTWTIADESIATIDTTNKLTIGSGGPSIQGLKQGETTLTATTGSGKTTSIQVIVFDPVTDFTVDEMRTVHVGEKIGLDIYKVPADSKEEFTFESANTDVATVDANGIVTGIKDGTASIIVRTSNNISKVCTVSVISRVSQIKILDAPIEMGIDETYTIRRASEENSTTGYLLFPDSTDGLTWVSSNTSIVTVDNYNGEATIKGIAQGTAVLTATSFSGESASINVTVVDAITELKFMEESKKLAIGTSATLALSKTPNYSTETIVYSSNDEKIAKVSQNGVVTGVGEGSTTITATGKISGRSASIPVTITVPSTKVQIRTEYVSEKKIYLVKGSSYQLKYKLLPENTTDNVRYTTSKKKIAEVSENGTISAKKKGTATISVIADSGKKATIKVYVVSKEKQAKKIKKISTSSVKVGQTARLKYTVTSANTTNTVQYSVNKPKLATVDEYGYITGLKKGTVKVTITLSNGKKKTKKIKVK